MNVMLMGRTEMLYDTAIELNHLKRHTPVCIATARAAKEYRKNEEDFKELADTLKIPFLLGARNNDELISLVRKVKPDICVSVNWPAIVGNELISIIPHGVLNLHFGDLPRFRGNATPNWAILMHEKEVVLTIHAMKPDSLDTGAIYCKRSHALDENTTIASIYDFARKNAASMFIEVIDLIASGKAHPEKQDNVGAFRCYPRMPSDHRIDWNKSASDIHALVRASMPDYPCHTYFMNEFDVIEKLIILDTRIVFQEVNCIGIPGQVIKNCQATGESWILCGKGVLAIKRCSLRNGIINPGIEWKSTRRRLGLVIEDILYKLYNERNVE